MAFKHSMVFLQNKSQCPLFPSKANHRLQIVLFPPKAIYQLPSSKCGSSELSGYITDTQPYLHGHGIATYWGKKTMVIPMKVTSTYHFHPCSCEKEKTRTHSIFLHLPMFSFPMDFPSFPHGTSRPRFQNRRGSRGPQLEAKAVDCRSPSQLAKAELPSTSCAQAWIGCFRFMDGLFGGKSHEMDSMDDD